MPRAVRLKRKSFFIDAGSLKRARKALGAKSDSEAVRVSLERVAEMEELWRFLDRTRGKLGPRSFEAP